MFSIGFIIIAVIIVVALLILFSFVPVGLWISALAAGVHVGIGTLVGMRLRRVSPRKVIAPLIKAHKAGLNLTTNQLESHYTIIARVGEGIVSTIGSSEHHTEVLENPDNISKTVLSKGLDSGTAFEILSIDIADVDISKNIGADLQTEQALADKNIAQAKAEERRAMAVASEQEMKARVQEMRAKVVEAESEVPLAMAEALRSGNIGVKDYYNLKNIEADTGMRNAINKRTDQNDDESPQQ
ncbi:MAG: flotillin-like FloA family protein [Staphylococcus epidermidis]|nr:flotillin-like FloA family protein [Staphylococcus epidermidis]